MATHLVSNRQICEASRKRCGDCRYRGGERHIGFVNGAASWISCRKDAPCPRRNVSLLDCLQRLDDFCRKWIAIP